MAIFFGMGAINGAALLQLTMAVQRLDPTACALRRSFEEMKDTPHAGWKGRKLRDAAAMIFRVVGCVMFSSTEPIRSVEDFSGAMFDRFVDIVTSKGYDWPLGKEDELRKVPRRRPTSSPSSMGTAVSAPML